MRVFVGLTFALAMGVALALPPSELAPLLSITITVLAVVVLTAAVALSFA